MGWLRYRVRAELRSRWRGLGALALFVALIGGVVLAAAAGARQTATAVNRLGAAGLDPTAFLDARGSDPAKWNRIAHLPSVAAAAPIAFVHAAPVRGGYYQFLASLDGQAGSTVGRGVLVAGRRPRSGAADEVALSEAAAKATKVRAGKTLELATVTPEAVANAPADGAEPEPDGPRLRLHVVGIVRGTQDLAVRKGNVTISILSRAFYEKYRSQVAMVEGDYLIRLRGGASAVKRFDRELRTLFAGGSAPRADAGSNVAFPLKQSTGVQTFGLAAFAGVFLLFGLGALGQAFSRTVHGGADDHVALSGIGVSERGRLVDAAAPAFLAAAAGCMGAIVVAIAASPLLPLGLARRTEPDVGVHVDLLVLLGGATVLLLATLAAVAWPAWRLSRRRPVITAQGETSIRPSIASRLTRTGTPSLAVGIGMATRRGRGPTEVAVRTALVGILVGVTGVAATIVFSSSLQRLLDTPSRYGWNWDVATTADPDTVARRPDTAAVAEAVLEQSAQIGGRTVYAFGLDVRKGHIAAPVSQGRGPASADEVALGADLRHSIARGRTVRITAGDKAATFRVVGTAVSASVDDPVPVGAGVLLTPEGLDRLGIRTVVQDSSGYHQTVIRFRPGVDVRRAVRTLYAPNENDRTITFPSPPAEVAKLDQVRGLPRVLAIFLGALAGLAIVHALVQTVQRRRVELGVLRAIGFTRGQVAGSMGWQAVTLAVVGAGVGLPLGVALGRWVWAAVANGLGVAPQPAVALPVFLVLPAAIAIAALAGAGLGAVAGRSPASVALRTE